MALVILSGGMLNQTRVRTVHFGTLLAIGSAVLVLLVGIAFGVGYFLASSAAPAVADGAAAQVTDAAVMNRVGELSGRLARLQSEAASLAHRIGTLKDFEHRLHGKPAANVVPPAGKAAAGGPMIPAFGSTASAPGLDSIAGEIDRLAAGLERLNAVTDARNLSFMAYPARLPVHDAERSSGFGNREDPFTGRLAFHSGLDFSAPTGTQIFASAGGRVISARRHADYGLMVVIDHGNGLVTRYAHASRLYVHEGEVVMPGQRIAAVGSTGRSTGAHLHFEVLDHGDFRDPALYLAWSR